MKWYLKIIAVYVLRFLLHIFYIFPIKKNRIIFSSFEGLAYTCNPKYIYQYLFDKDYDKWEYVWCLNEKSQLPKRYRSCTKIVSFLSVRYVYYIMTSKVIISNLGIEPIFPKRRKQIFINTWHGGGAYKRVQFDMNMSTKLRQNYSRLIRDIRKKGTDFFISSCQRFTDVSSQGFNIDENKFLPIGLPRNDMFFDNEKNNDYRKCLANRYKIKEDSLWVLYAPTFRGSYRSQENPDTKICSAKVVNSLRQRFGKQVTMMTRGHTPHKYLEINNAAIADIVDLTDYPDMQELLAAIDVLITDYSSSIWDFAITGKPAFLFVPDLLQFDEDRGFYTPIIQWPYPYADNIDDFCELINSYESQKGKDKIAFHQKLLGSFEKGEACKYIYDLIHSISSVL